MRREWALVNEPFSCPNSSLSSRVSGRAAQLTGMNARSRRGEFSWMVRAASSLPTPLSPSSSTVALDGATRPIRSKTLRMDGASPSILPLPWRVSFSPRFSRSIRS